MKIITFDTETTGLPVRGGSIENQPYIVQFAAIQHSFDPETKELCEITRYDQLIKPDIAIPYESARIHGITDQMVVQAPKLCEVIDEILDLFARSDVAVAHNIDFDKTVIEGELKRLGRPARFLPPQLLDTMQIAEGVCKIDNYKGGYKSPTLSEMHAYIFGADFSGAHNAMQDVEATANCLQELLFEGHAVVQVEDEMRLF